MPAMRKIITIASLVLTGLTLSSCESFGVNQIPKLPLTAATEAVVKPQLPPTKESVNKSPMIEVMQTKSELYPAMGNAISSVPMASKKAKPAGTGAYTLNFDDADLAEVAKTILSDSLGENYVLSPEVKGKVTLQTTQALTKEELLPTLEMVLRMNNAALVKDDNIYHIEPAGSAVYTSNISAGGTTAGYQTRIIPVRNVAADEIAKLLKPLVQEKTILQTDNNRNILLASGSSDEMQRVVEMVSTFDTDVLKGRSFALFTLAHVEPEAVIKELDAVFNNKSGDKDKDASSSFFRFIPIERLNAILAISHQARYLRDIESWVFRLDKANVASGGGVNVYKVQHVDAVELADTLNEIFNSTPKKTKAPKVAAGETAGEISSTTSESRQSSVGNATIADVAVSNVGKVRIIADEPNNSIVIVATAHEYEVIRPIINQLDVMPLQVLIDATIVEVDLKNDLKYGMQWSFDTGNFHNLLTDVTSGNLKAIGPVTGYSLFYSGGTAKAVLNALAEKSAINVIASPSLMVLNNQEAFINVGDKVPIATSQSTNNNSVNVTSNGILPTNNDNVSAIVSNNIQMVDTGVTLKITPRVNAGGLVLMKIEQEANQAVPTTTSSLNSPTIQQRKINSSIAVKNGETIILGGLIREENGRGLTGMPILSDIPILGSLFGTTSSSSNKTELVILITPRIVQNEKNARDVTNEFKRKLTGIYQDVPR